MSKFNTYFDGLSPSQLASFPYYNTNSSLNMVSTNPGDSKSDATEEVHTCANCRKDADDQQPCTGCINAPDNAGGVLATTWFCGMHCELEYEPGHLAACRAADCRRTLYRAGRTTQLIFQRCRETLSKISIARVEKYGQYMYVYQANDTGKQSLQSLSSLFDSEEDKEAAISCMASSTAIPFVRALLEHMLPDLLLRLVRVDHTVQPPPRRIITISPDGTQIDNTTQPHSIIQITLPDSESSAIDITGNQYGYDNPVVPWEIYKNSRIQDVRRVRLLPSLKDDQGQIEDDDEYQFVAALVEAIKKWEGEIWPLQYVLTGGWTRGEAEYLGWRGDFLEHVDRWVKDYVAGKEEAGSAGAVDNQ